jgi:hypothetical protein
MHALLRWATGVVLLTTRVVTADEVPNMERAHFVSVKEQERRKKLHDPASNGNGVPRRRR